ncbi:MAG: nucleotidyltransferase [Cyclobacteriaceae bacterium]
MQNQIRELLRRTCELLNKHQVEYILSGGVAVGFHGYPRSTADIDFWYNPTISNFHRIISALKEYGVDTDDLTNIVFDPAKTYLRVPQLGFRTEFLPQIPGIDSFSMALKNASQTTLDGVNVFILGYEDLIKNKAKLARKIDLNDIEELKKRNKH